MGEELDGELLGDIVEIAGLIKPYYQVSFDDIEVGRNEKRQYFIVTDRYDYLSSENIKIYIEKAEDGRLLLKGVGYLRQYFEASAGILDASEAFDYIDAVLDDWSIKTDHAYKAVWIEAPFKESFATSYGNLLDCLTEILVAAAFCESIKAVRIAKVAMQE